MITRIAPLGLVLVALGSDARADCADPRGCWANLCDNPGNVVELTVLGPPDRGTVLPVRVERLELVDEAFEQPAVGDELGITLLGVDAATLPANRRIVAVTQGAGQAWPVFASSAEGASCLTGGDGGTLTSTEIGDVLRSGDCSAPPIPPVGECDDFVGIGCEAGHGAAWLPMVLASVALVRLRRKNHN